MTKPIWSKPGTTGAGESVQAFLAGDDIRWDRVLFPFDIQATLAHARGLGRIGILEPGEVASMEEGLVELEKQYAEGEVKLEPPYEDGHSVIEAFLTEKLGPLGGKVHTGRSRNDQVQVALRLYMRDRLDQLTAVNACIARALLDRADKDGGLLMPGYTHLQHAVPSTAGLWLAGLAEAFIDNAALSGQTRKWLNTSPLGTAAGYGVNLPLDRDGVAAELRFDRLQINPQYAQNSRGRFELQALTALAQSTLELRRLAWDLSLYTSQEFQFVKLDASYTTGSSIMPNKANPDTVELLRALHAPVQGALAELQAALSLPSGYHRDLQVTKPPLIRAFESALAGLALVPDIIDTLTFNPEAMANALDRDMLATDVAIDAARQGKPFREAYQQAMSELPEGEEIQAAAANSVTRRTSPGACADLRLDELRERLELFL